MDNPAICAVRKDMLKVECWVGKPIDAMKTSECASVGRR